MSNQIGQLRSLVDAIERHLNLGQLWDKIWDNDTSGTLASAQIDQTKKAESEKTGSEQVRFMEKHQLNPNGATHQRSRRRLGFPLPLKGTINLFRAWNLASHYWKWRLLCKMLVQSYDSSCSTEILAWVHVFLQPTSEMGPANCKHFSHTAGWNTSQDKSTWMPMPFCERQWIKNQKRAEKLSRTTVKEYRISRSAQGRPIWKRSPYWIFLNRRTTYGCLKLTISTTVSIRR